MKVTLRDIAKAAGVSVSTVSRALSPKNSARLSPQTVALVEREAARLGYIQRTPDNGHRETRIRAACVIVGGVECRYTEPFYAGVLFGLEKSLRSHGGELYRVFDKADLLQEDTWERMAGDGVCALLIIDLSLPEGLVERVQSLGWHVLRVAVASDPTFERDVVMVDAAWGARTAVQHLVELGYRRIAIIAADSFDRSPEEEKRTLGYRRAMQEAGLKVPDGYLACGGWSEDSGYRAMQSLLSLPEPPSAVFAASDRMAIGAMRAAHDAGKSVPEDVAFVGFDDIPMAAYSEPALTTVQVPREHLGELAAKLLLDRVRGELPPVGVKVLLDTRLVVRGSTQKTK